MKRYYKLPIPKDSAFGRKSWYYKLHWKIREFLQGVGNIIRWSPTIYKDRNWDQWYIAELLQRKLEFQRKELVKANRFVGVEGVNKDLTLALNLLERLKEEYYSTEYWEYKNVNEYLTKYKRAVQFVIKKHELDNSDKERIKFYVASYNQEKNDRIFWKLMFYKFPQWWD